MLAAGRRPERLTLAAGEAHVYMRCQQPSYAAVVLQVGHLETHSGSHSSASVAAHLRYWFCMAGDTM